MSLGDAVSAALPELRAHAESMMTDTCRVTRAVEPVWDEPTGTYTSSSVALYEGPCKIRLSSSVVRDVDSQGQLFAVQGPRLDLPVMAAGVWSEYLTGLLPGDVLYPAPVVVPEFSAEGESADILPGDSAVILSSLNDPGVVGTVLTIKGRFVQTFATARRFPVEVQA